jgi:hypothetical protein
MLTRRIQSPKHALQYRYIEYIYAQFPNRCFFLPIRVYLSYAFRKLHKISIKERMQTPYSMSIAAFLMVHVSYCSAII